MVDNKRETYKVSEIMVSLREYLLEGYRILDDMLSLIDIGSPVPYKTHIKISQGSATNLFTDHIIYRDSPYDGKILLFISKSRFSPARMIRDYKTRYVEDENPLYSVDNADFIIKAKGENFVFEKRYDHDIPRTYKPTLNILNKEKFAKLYKRLEDEGYLTYPSIMYFHYEKGLDYSFVLSSQSISLEQNDSVKRGLMIQYNPYDDSFFIRDNRKNPKLSAKEMLDLPIDRCEIHEGYASIIDKNLDNNLDFSSMLPPKAQKLLGDGSEEKGHQKALRRIIKK